MGSFRDYSCQHLCPQNSHTICRASDCLKRITKLQSVSRASYSENPRNPKISTSSVDPNEMRIFSGIKDWWDPVGSQRALHAYNRARVEYIKRIYHIHGSKEGVQNKNLPFLKKSMIDVGCGAGIFAESAARLGGNVLGVDATKAVIEIAEAHARLDPGLQGVLTYKNITAEDVVAQNKKFDIVTSLEVIEHISNKDFFVDSLSKLTKDKGLVFVSTINKTWAAYGVTILGAEMLTRIVPKGTHEYDKYISPDDLAKLLTSHGLSVLDIKGFFYNPLTNYMVEFPNTSVNYIIACRKN